MRERRNVTTLLVTVQDIDRAANEVVQRNGELVPIDALVIATCVRHAFFGNDWWGSDAHGLKTALLRKSAFGQMVPFPVALQAIASISALQRAEKGFMIAMRIWLWRSGSWGVGS
jgi:hypothetical protein